ncbi:MAG TPA: glycerate kinase [Bryobacteraceae bacterium]|nr:glycerate kinase [Bryobacteraceae bacterium]
MNRAHAMRIFRAALDAADAEKAVLRKLRLDGTTLVAGRRRHPLSRFDRIFVLGAGKAGAGMARAVERVLGRRISGGLVNVKDAGGVRLHRIELKQCGHPIPDERGRDGALRFEQIARDVGERDLILCLISGGASALTPAVESLREMQRATSRLLNAGANIHELNTVRKHMDRLKGGQLARLAWPATVIALILSDVVGDDLDVIGSGPTVADRSTVQDAAAVFRKYGIKPPALHETPKKLDRVQNILVGSNRLAMDAAAKEARGLGYRTLVLSSMIEGEAREVAGVHAAIVKEIFASGRPVRAPACILSGGETTVTVRGKGLGGRNTEFVLAAAIALEGIGPVTIFSAGTDGTDGPTDAAGAVADERTVSGMDARSYLADNDSYRFFEKAGGLVKTGATGTNVMDVRVILLADGRGRTE